MAGTPRGILTAGLTDPRNRAERGEPILRAVARGLRLALGRAARARQFETQRDALNARTAALAPNNETLETVASSVSHAFRAPVRQVRGFADLARKASGTTHPEVAAWHLEVVYQAGLRMTALIDGMLRLSPPAGALGGSGAAGDPGPARSGGDIRAEQSSLAGRLLAAGLGKS